MRSTFFGIETARRALNAQQTALDLTGHNIANANTPGYSRQVATLTATSPYPAPGFNQGAGAGQIGTGVEVAGIQRLRDEFIETQWRKETQYQGRWQARWEALQQTELIFTEPSDTGIRASLDAFWSALQELAKRPEEAAVRAVVRERAVVLTDTIRHIYSQLTTQRADLNQQIKIKVTEVNSLARQIADLNAQIVQVTSSGLQPNDLLDKRDLLLGNLAKLVNITTYQTADGGLNVNIGGIGLVEGKNVREIKTEPDLGDDGMLVLKWEGLSGAGERVNITNGTLSGLLEIRADLKENYLERMNVFVKTLADKFNEIHLKGFGLDGTDNHFEFFTSNAAGVPVNAANISVNPIILDDSQNGLSKIAASTVQGVPGNGENALALAGLKQQANIDFSGTYTGSFNDFYGSFIAQLGVDAQKAQQMATNQELLVGHLENWRESVAGVSLDEEMANMIRFQHAYNAAARAMTAVDETLETIINHMGLVGR